jgi:hypothetical protein
LPRMGHQRGNCVCAASKLASKNHCGEKKFSVRSPGPPDRWSWYRSLLKTFRKALSCRSELRVLDGKYAIQAGGHNIVMSRKAGGEYRLAIFVDSGSPRPSPGNPGKEDEFCTELPAPYTAVKLRIDRILRLPIAWRPPVSHSMARHILFGRTRPGRPLRFAL